MRKHNRFALYAGIFLVSLSAILLEISFTKLFSVTLWYHFAYFVVSLALYGLGAGGLIAFFLQDYVKANLNKFLAWASFLQFVSIAYSLFIILNFRFKPGFSLSGLSDLTILYLLCSTPFIFTGLIVALTMQRYFEDVSKIYFSDLLGAATGCIVFLFAIRHFSGPAVVTISGLIALTASACFYFGEFNAIPIKRLSLVGALVGALLWAHNKTDIFSVKYAKTYDEFANVLFEKWSPLSRITVYPSTFFSSPDHSWGFGWGMSKKYRPQGLIEQLWVEQDACAGTPITRFDGDLSKLEFLKYDITSLPYHLKRNAKAFIIGCGGGRDVLTALVFKNPEIFACDIHPVIIDLVKNRYREFAGNLYQMPQVKVEVAEARNHIRRSSEHFDIIQIPLIDSWAATTAGAFTLAENSLYTVEAFTDYFNHLTDNGVLAVTRYLFMPRNQSLRVAIIARKALEDLGEASPEKNIVVVGTTKLEGVATILAKKKPFDSAEIQRISEIAGELGFEILYLPGYPGDPDFTSALTTQPLEDFLRTSYYDLRPVTDDRPFFFTMIYFSSALDLILGKKLAGQTFNYYAPAVLLALIVISIVLIIVFYLAPLIVSSKVKSLPRAWVLYFILLGIGFMFVEIPFIQKGSLYLGHPTYGFSVVLFSMLVFGGAGSYCSGRISISRLPRLLYLLLFVVAILVGSGAFFMHWLVSNTIGLPFYAKVAITIWICGITAFLMGMALPSGVRLLGQSFETSIPWVWALNGGASVLGSIVAMAISMSFGYRNVLLLGGLSYAFASLVAWHLTRTRKSGLASLD